MNGTGGYDAVGNVVAYQYEDSTGRIDQYNVTYYLKDSYLEAGTSGLNVTNTPNVRPATDQSFYDDRGNRVAIVQHTQANGGQLEDDVRVFAYNGYGQIIERRDGTAAGDTFSQGSNTTHENQHYVYVNGEQVAHFDEGGTLDVLTQVTAFDNTGAGTGGYVVQRGDTLRSIAQAVYGNAAYWYVIAQANAISSDSDLAIGQNLTLPQITTTSNTATTFKPYNPSDISGSTTPNLPTVAPPPVPPAHHCNVLAAIVVVAVVVVASVVTFGAALATLGPVGAAALGAAAGSAAGQLAGDATGTHQGFSFGEVFTAAAVAAATAGIGQWLGETGEAASAVADGASTTGEAAGTVASTAGTVAADAPVYLSFGARLVPRAGGCDGRAGRGA